MARSFNIHQFGSARETNAFRPFLSYLSECRSVLDLGCGRGVFLELMESAGIKATGIDLDEQNISVCQEAGFRVFQQDALTYLESCAETYDAVFCSHLIEHLPGLEGARLVEQCVRVLNDGGVLILVTPNPANLRVLTEIFWLDLSHVRPYPLTLVRRLCEDYGLRVAAAGARKQEAWYDIYRKCWHAVRNLFLNGRYYGEGDLQVIAHKTRSRGDVV